MPAVHDEGILKRKITLSVSVVLLGGRSLILANEQAATMLPAPALAKLKAGNDRSAASATSEVKPTRARRTENGQGTASLRESSSPARIPALLAPSVKVAQAYYDFDTGEMEWLEDAAGGE